MSLSSPREKSPVQKFFKIRASTGDVVYYDKSQGKEVGIPTPFKFIVLDVLNAVGGFHEPSNSGIWSNEVRSSNKDILKVRTKAGVLAEGPYAEIKDKLKALGGKFANSVYIAYQEDGDWALGNITFIGASVSEWFDFGKGRYFDVDPGVVVTGFSARKKGRTDFFVPVFARWQVAPDDLSSASRLDQTLQSHLQGAPTAEPSFDEPPAQPQFSQQPAFGGDPEPPF